jgi:hypothetical protein
VGGALSGMLRWGRVRMSKWGEIGWGVEWDAEVG